MAWVLSKNLPNDAFTASVLFCRSLCSITTCFRDEKCDDDERKYKKNKINLFLLSVCKRYDDQVKKRTKKVDVWMEQHLPTRPNERTERKRHKTPFPFGVLVRLWQSEQELE
jgi:hypothetical protein